MEDVAAQAGVSRSLVSLVMRGSPRVSEQSRDRVLAAAGSLGYRPNLSARNLASGQTQTVGVMLNDLHNPYFTEFTEGLAAAASKEGMQILVNSGWQQDGGEINAIDSLLNMRTDGIVLGAPRISLPILEDFAAQAPMVALSIVGQPRTLDTINNNEQHGARLVVEHLVELGHERIAHIDAGLAPGGPERRDAFMAAMVAHGLSPVIVSGDFDDTAGYLGAENLLTLKTPPTAIFASNDLSAVGVLSYLQSQGVRVPDDISVVGYDDTMLAGMGSMGLTTVHQPREQLGQRCMELLLERIGGRTDACHELVEPRLVVRSSTGAAQDGRATYD